VLIAALWLFIQHTRLGSDPRHLAGSVPRSTWACPSDRIFALVMGIFGPRLAAAAGCFGRGLPEVQADDVVAAYVKAFAIVVVGGLGFDPGQASGRADAGYAETIVAYMVSNA